MTSLRNKSGELAWTVLAAIAALTLLTTACSDPAADPSAADTVATDAQPADTAADALPGEDLVPADVAEDATPVDAVEDVAPEPFTLQSISPDKGSSVGGEVVTLTGSGFNETVQVLIGGTPLDPSAITFIDSKRLEIRTPPHETGLVDVEVVLPGDPSLSSRLDKAYLYANALVLTSVQPSTGPVAGGTPLVLSGSGFTGKVSVLIGGRQALGVQVSGEDQILAVTPPGVFGPATVHVVSDQGAAVMKKGFFYTAAPTVASLIPGAGPTAGGTQAVLTGTGLTKDADVTIGGAKATILALVGVDRLEIATPPGMAGKADVVVTTTYGTGALAGGFVYTDDQGQAATQLLSVAPASGPLAGGGVATLVATGLVSAGDTTVLFGNQVAKVVEIQPAAHTLVVQVPKGGVAGPVAVVLMTSKGTGKLADGYTYTDTLGISSVTPSSGSVEGNTKIVIKGSGFSKGKPTVRIGALSTSTVLVVSDAELQAVTPPGSPGYVPVSVQVGTQTAVLPNGFAYSSKDLQLYVPYPSTGAQAGGTYVHVYGNGFSPALQLLFDGKPATHLTFLDPTHVTCKTPPGKVGAVDVTARLGTAQAVAAKAFTYFNPKSAYGGTWGADVDGAINLTVLDASNSEPVPDAFTMLWTDPTTPYQGFTNADGQITFSGPGLSGKQMVSASKEAYESASIVLFDATNVTLYITPIPPPSSGSPPPGKAPPTVSGKVVGLDKYVFVPVGSCSSQLGVVPSPICSSCDSDASCSWGGPGVGCVDIGENNGKRCVADCSLGQQCTSGFKCMPMQSGPARCVPVKGELTSVCLHTKPSVFDQDNYPPEGKGFEANAKNFYNYKINTFYGEMAIVCFGGYKTPGAVLVPEDAASMQAFTPTVMGVRRNLMVGAEGSVTGVNIQLDMPLTGKAVTRLDLPPIWPTQNYIVSAAWAYLVLGGDGVLRMPYQDMKFLYPFTETDPDHLEIQQLPAALSGDLHDASISILGIVVDLGVSQLPYSMTLKQDIKTYNDDAMLRLAPGGDFEAVPTGIDRNLYGLWGKDANDMYAVGAQGGLVHWSGNGWTLQPPPGKADLRGVYGHGEKVWAVGWAGSAAVKTGIKWETLPVVPTTANLNAVFATADGQGEAVWAAAQNGIYRLQDVAGQATWKATSPPVFGNLLAIHGSDKDHIWAVGQTYGAIWAWDGQVWKLQPSGTSIALRSVWAVGPTSVYAVGEKGTILHFDGITWKPMKSPVTTTLASVSGTSDSDVWAVGSRGVVVHWDGQTWQEVDTPISDKALNAVWATQDGHVYAVGEGELLLGPMLYPPLPNQPLDSGVLTGTTLKWTVDPATVEPHFNYVTLGIPGMMGDTPVWNIMTKGNVSQVELPDFPTIQGTPGIPKGTPLRLTIIRGYKEGFDIDAYDLSDLDQLTWRSWSVHSYFFTRQ
jgi:hypothetical protein